jgi:tellurium resistance protein TerZ
MINLKKGSSISLEKDGKSLENIYVGLNWGKIKSMWGLFESNVDLDGSVSMFDKEKRLVDTVYFRKRRSDDRSVYHSGDDIKGDSSNDGKDNETICIDLKRVSRNVENIVVYLNSYRGQQFHTIPYANIRLLEGDAAETKKVFATFNLASEPSFKGKVSMVMAKLNRTGDNWKFMTIGEPVDTTEISDTVSYIRKNYL